MERRAPRCPLVRRLAPTSALRGICRRSSTASRKETGRTTTGIVPVRVRLPEFGPSIFLAAELTAETRLPLLELAYKRVN